MNSTKQFDTARKEKETIKVISFPKGSIQTHEPTKKKKSCEKRKHQFKDKFQRKENTNYEKEGKNQFTETKSKQNKNLVS